MIASLMGIGLVGVGVVGGCAQGPRSSVQVHDQEWYSAESEMLTDYVQLTFAEDWVKAGESYFDPSGDWIIFQAVARPSAGETTDEHYSMYVAKLEKSAKGEITGLGESLLISEPGSANTCGFFHPTEPGAVVFGSTSVPPKMEDQPGYQRGTGRYRWAFPVEMDVVTTVVPEVRSDVAPHLATLVRKQTATPLMERPGGYDAECAYSPDGRHVVFGSIEPGNIGADLWVIDLYTNVQRKIIEADGYDGGPFFSPDGGWICYRSDREGNNLLQLFIARLRFDDGGAIIGVEREVQLTANEHVNWAPFWHPSGRYLVYSTSEVSHRNYEVFAIDGDPAMEIGERNVRRVTHAEGFDGLPVFNHDGGWMMWTSQRGAIFGDDERPTSQVWVARVVDAQP
jgi:hypothetical protein